MALSPLATPDDVAARLLRALTVAEIASATQQLAAASAVIRGEVRQDFELVEDDAVTLLVTQPGEWLHLPQHPVVEVASVTLGGLDITDYTIQRGSRGTRLYRRAGWYSASLAFTDSYYPDPVTFVDVVYTHGSDPIPADVVAVAVNLALPQIVNPRGAKSFTIGDWSETTDNGAATMAPSLLTVEDLRRRYLNRRALRSVPLRRVWGA